ncbi:MAG: GNAT family N-acetyltransferase [Spirochaetaceae bacterium]
MLFEINRTTDAVKELISLCIGYPTDEKVENKLNIYLNSEEHRLYRNADFSGIIGIRHKCDDVIEITSIAVSTDKRKQYLGKNLIDDLIKMENCKSIFAETDNSTVGFYRKYGFSFENLGENYPGFVRYLCKLECSNLITTTTNL